MYPYSLAQWFLFFYIYCFLGWVWESCYVSVKQKRWVNRGFMHGPFLPIYGSGAIMVLLVTIPVKEHLELVFLSGMVGATVLEYCTGAAMEAIFHVRYWDYSKKPFNLNGHICLMSSLAWGVFSILMIQVLHEPIESLVLILGHTMTEFMAFALTIGVAVDMTESFNEAMDLREILSNLSESNAEVKLIRKKLDFCIAVVDQDTSKLKEKLLQSKQMIEDKLIEEKKRYEIAFRERIEDKTLSGRRIIENNIERVMRGKHYVLSTLTEKANTYIQQIDEYTKERGIEPVKEMTKLKAELEEVLEKLSWQKEKTIKLKNKNYIHSINLLKRNPNAVSKKYESALKEIKEMGEVSNVKESSSLER